MPARPLGETRHRAAPAWSQRGLASAGSGQWR
jgi:hypothetical protein